jgi:peptidoglycan hydrolase CwlO-like protein
MKNKIINIIITLFIVVIIYYVYSIYYTIYESIDNPVYDYLNSDITRIENKLDNKNKSVDNIIKQVMAMKSDIKINSNNITDLEVSIRDYKQLNNN